MSTADQQIAGILAKYGEPIAGNIWRVQGQAVIYHKALERIAAQAGIGSVLRPSCVPNVTKRSFS